MRNFEDFNQTLSFSDFLKFFRNTSVCNFCSKTICLNNCIRRIPIAHLIHDTVTSVTLVQSIDVLKWCELYYSSWGVCSRITHLRQVLLRVECAFSIPLLNNLIYYLGYIPLTFSLSLELSVWSLWPSLNQVSLLWGFSVAVTWLMATFVWDLVATFITATEKRK